MCDLRWRGATHPRFTPVVWCLQTQVLYDAAVHHEASSDWAPAAETWKACVNETLRQTAECRAQCEVASQALPEDRGVGGVFEKAAGKPKGRVFPQHSPHVAAFPLRPALALSLLACRQYCVTQVAMRPGRISAHEDFLPSQLEHLHIAQFKGQCFKCRIERPTLRWVVLFICVVLNSCSAQLEILVERCRPSALCSSFTPLTRTLWTTCSSTLRR